MTSQPTMSTDPMCIWTSVSIVVKTRMTPSDRMTVTLVVICEEAYPCQSSMPFPEIWKSAEAWSLEAECGASGKDDLHGVREAVRDTAGREGRERPRAASVQPDARQSGVARADDVGLGGVAYHPCTVQRLP